MPQYTYNRASQMVTLSVDDFMDLLANQAPPPVPEDKPAKTYDIAALSGDTGPHRVGCWCRTCKP